MERPLHLNNSKWWAGLIAALVFAVVWSVSAGPRDGFVKLRNGTIYNGYLRLESNEVVVVDLDRELLVSIPWTNIVQVSLPTDLTSRSRVAGEAASSANGEASAWTNVDIGAVMNAGEMRIGSEGDFRLRSSGTNLNCFRGPDSFQFVYRELRGDGQCVARVMDVENVHGRTQAGLVIREGLGAEARQVAVTLTAGRLGLLTTRERLEEDPKIMAERRLRLPQWIKLDRFGNEFTAFASRDGRRWSLLGRAVVPMSEEVLIGLGTVSMREGELARARLDHVREGDSLAPTGFVPQIHLVGGSVQMGPIERLEDETIRLGVMQGAPVSTRVVSSIRYRAVPYRAANRMAKGEPGVYLTNGDFVAGEVRSIRHGQVVVSSVPLGLLHFDAEAEVAAIVFRKPGALEAAPCRLVMADGSTWLAASLAIEGPWVVVRGSPYGWRRMPVADAVELEWRRRG